MQARRSTYKVKQINQPGLSKIVQIAYVLGDIQAHRARENEKDEKHLDPSRIAAIFQTPKPISDMDEMVVLLNFLIYSG
jgi:hypothetical protein